MKHKIGDYCYNRSWDLHGFIVYELDDGGVAQFSYHALEIKVS
jgi:hypothetical protein